MYVNEKAGRSSPQVRCSQHAAQESEEEEDAAEAAR